MLKCAVCEKQGNLYTEDAEDLAKKYPLTKAFRSPKIFCSEFCQKIWYSPGTCITTVKELLATYPAQKVDPAMIITNMKLSPEQTSAKTIDGKPVKIINQILPRYQNVKSVILWLADTNPANEGRYDVNLFTKELQQLTIDEIAAVIEVILAPAKPENVGQKQVRVKKWLRDLFKTDQSLIIYVYFESISKKYSNIFDLISIDEFLSSTKKRVGYYAISVAIFYNNATFMESLFKRDYYFVNFDFALAIVEGRVNLVQNMYESCARNVPVTRWEQERRGIEMDNKQNLIFIHSYKYGQFDIIKYCLSNFSKTKFWASLDTIANFNFFFYAKYGMMDMYHISFISNFDPLYIFDYAKNHANVREQANEEKFHILMYIVRDDRFCVTDHVLDRALKHGGQGPEIWPPKMVWKALKAAKDRQGSCSIMNKI